MLHNYYFYLQQEESFFDIDDVYILKVHIDLLLIL